MRIRSERLERVLAWVTLHGLQLLFRTVHHEVHLTEPDTDPYGGRSFVVCLWHDAIILPTFMRPSPPQIALVGPHRDGGLFATILKGRKITAVRGSSSRQGAEAVRKLLQSAPDQHVTLTPDGPRGPRREMKTGCAFLSAKTGKPVLPIGFACDRYWSFGKGWTDLVIPKPFARLYAVTGQTFRVPADAKREELDEYTRQIQQEMDRVTAVAEELARNRGRLPEADGAPSLRRAA